MGRKKQNIHVEIGEKKKSKSKVQGKEKHPSSDDYVSSSGRDDNTEEISDSNVSEVMVLTLVLLMNHLNLIYLVLMK